LREESIPNITGAFAAVSEAEDASLCVRNRITFMSQKNTTAGDKWNAVLNYVIRESDTTHFLILGDDDSISTEGVKMLIAHAMRGNPYVGFKKNYFVDTKRDRAHSHTQPYQADKLIGAGCLISRKAIFDACSLVEITVHKTIEGERQTLMPGRHVVSASVARYLEGYKGFATIQSERWVNLWPSKGNGLDHSREMRLVMAGHAPKAIDDDRIHITDFKSARNIWDYDSVREKFRGPLVSKDEAMWFMSDSEKDYVRSLMNKIPAVE
jgi:hypothetical protein